MLKKEGELKPAESAKEARGKELSSSGRIDFATQKPWSTKHKDDATACYYQMCGRAEVRAVIRGIQSAWHDACANGEAVECDTTLGKHGLLLVCAAHDAAKEGLHVCKSVSDDTLQVRSPSHMRRLESNRRQRDRG